MSHQQNGNGRVDHPERLVVVRVEDTIEPNLTTRTGSCYQSPPQPREQAMTLVRLLLGHAEAANGSDRWTAPDRRRPAGRDGVRGAGPVRRRIRLRLVWMALGAVGAVALSCAPTLPGQPGARWTGRGGDPLTVSIAPANVVQRQPAPGSCHARGSDVFVLPDPHCTPGAIDPAITQRNIGPTICRKGFTARERPPEWVSETEKRASLAAYGDIGPLREYEYDHLVPLALAGGANDPRNMWPEPGASPNPKDTLERLLAKRVCSRRMALAYAQRLIAKNWVAAYRRYVSAGGTR